MAGVFVIIQKQIGHEKHYLCLLRGEKLNNYPKGVYELPGGGIDEGEDLYTAINREVFEELGWDLNSINENGVDLFATFNRQGSDSHYFCLTLNHRAIHLKPRISDEHTGHIWLTGEQIDGLPRLQILALHRDMVGLWDSPEGRTGVDDDFYYEFQNGVYVCRYGEKRENSQEYKLK